MEVSESVLETQNYGNQLVQSLNDIWSRDMFCDVTLTAGDTSVDAHRVVLSAGSRYFATMLGSSLKEGSQSEPIVLQGIEGAALSLLVKYIYSGSLTLNHQIVEPVLYAADMFDMPKAVALCCQFLLKALTPYNSLYTLRLGDMHGNEELYRAALRVVSEQFNEVVKSVDFLSCSPNQAVDLLNSDDLNVRTEVTVLQGAFAWLNHNNLLRTATKAKISERLGDSTELEENVTLTEEEVIEALSEGEQRVKDRVIEAVRFSLLSKEYMEGLEDDMVMRICPDTIKYGLRQRALIPEARDKVSLRAGMFADRIYVAGGTGSSLAELSKLKLNLENYDPVHREWSKVSEPEFMVSEPHVGVLAYLAGYLYVIGGTDSSGSACKLVHRYHLQTGTWSKVSPMTTAGTHQGVVVEEGIIYVAGGWDGSSQLSTFEKYDPSTDLWRRMKSMNRSRMEFPLVACSGSLFAIGGNTNDYTNRAQAMEVYNVAENGWQELQPTIRPRWFPGGAVAREYIFVCGLPSRDRANLRNADKTYTVERYCPRTGQWMVMPNLRTPVGGATMVCIKNELYVLGGSDGSGPLSSCASAVRYDADERAWQSIEPMLVARVGASAAVT